MPDALGMDNKQHPSDPLPLNLAARCLRVPARFKNNLADDRSGLAYEIRDSGNGVPSVAWDPEPVTISADDALGQDGRKAGAGAALEEAMEWLRDALCDGPRPADELKQQAESDGIARRTLDRAKKRVGVVSRRAGKAWVWELPAEPTEPQECQDRQGGDAGALERAGPSRTRPGATENTGSAQDRQGCQASEVGALGDLDGWGEL